MARLSRLYPWPVALLGLTMLVLSGCSTMPEPLQLGKEVNTVSFGSVIQQPNKFVGSSVQWGGVIANVSNKSDHSIIEVAFYPISSSGRPQIDTGYSTGRFRARLQGLADPMVFQRGKAITFAGTLSQPMKGQIGEYEYNFPLVVVTGHVLWQDLPDYDWRYHHPTWPGRDPYFWGDRFWYSGHYHHGNKRPMKPVKPGARPAKKVVEKSDSRQVK